MRSLGSRRDYTEIDTPGSNTGHWQLSASGGAVTLAGTFDGPRGQVGQDKECHGGREKIGRGGLRSQRCCLRDVRMKVRVKVRVKVRDKVSVRTGQV